MCKNLFHQTTKPLALASSAVSHGLIWSRRRLPVRGGRPSKATRSGCGEQWGLGSAALIVAACISLPPVKDSCFSLPVTSQHCLLSSWCSWAKLEYAIQNWLCLLKEHGSCLSSSLLRSFLCPEECHMELSTSCHPCCFLLRFLKNKWTDFISVNRLLGWQQHVKKIIAKSLERLQPKDSRPGV